MVVPADGAKTLLDEGEEGAFLLLGEVRGHALGAAVDGADLVAHFGPDVNHCLDVVLAEVDSLLLHVRVRVY